MAVGRAFCLISIILLYYLFLEAIESLKLIEVKIPKHVIRFGDARLECIYDLENESLYSITWYKNGLEFFKYRNEPAPYSSSLQFFIHPEVAINISQTTKDAVVLSKADFGSSGNYECEIIGQEPKFEAVKGSGDLVVVLVPVEGPKISVYKWTYEINDTVTLTCTSGSSHPPTTLEWFINGRKFQDDNLPFRLRPKHVSTGNGFYKTILALEFQVNEEHFMDGHINVKCAASMPPTYWKTAEITLKMKNKALLETFRPNEIQISNTRAVAAGSLLQILLIYRFLLFL